MNPRDRWPSIAALSSAVDFGGSGLSDIPILIERVIVEDAWRDFETPLGGRFRNKTFREFVIAKPSKGLGSDPARVLKYVEGTPAEPLVRESLKGESGRPPKADNQEEPNNNIIGFRTRQGTSRSYTLDRLQREAPQLFEAVQREELSPNAAAIQAGFRKRTITVRTDNAVSIAKALRKQLNPTVLKELLTLLEAE